MSEELLPLTNEQLAKYETVIDKIRSSKEWREFRQIMEHYTKEYHAASAEGRVVKISSKLREREEELRQSVYAYFEKEALNIPGAIEKRETGKKNFFQKVFGKKEKDFFVRFFVEKAFWKELEKKGSFKECYNEGVDEYNRQQNGSKTKVETKIETKVETKKPEPTQQTTSNDNQAHEPNSTDTLSTENQKSENKITLEEIQKKYYNHIENNTGSADELWHMANYLEQNDKSGEYTKHIVYAIVDRDPTFKPETMLAIVSKNVFDGYTDFDAEDQIRDYSKGAEVIGLLAEHNPELSSAIPLNILNKISKETVGCYTDNIDNNDVRTAFLTATYAIIPAYGKCKYDTPKQAETALQNITHITKSLDADRRNPHDVINTVHTIVNNSEPDKDVATSAFRALNLVSPQNSEEASKMLSLYRTLSLENPDLAEASIMKMGKIFNDFPHDEKLQKECLSALEALNGNRSKFDEDAQKKLDSRLKAMKSKIYAGTILRAQGIETDKEAPTTSNSQRGTTNTQSNFDLRSKDR